MPWLGPEGIGAASVSDSVSIIRPAERLVECSGLQAGTLLVLWAMFKRLETQRAAVVGATSSTAGVPRPGGSEDPSHVVEHASAAPL